MKDINMTSPTRLLYNETKEDEAFNEWYRDNDIPVKNYYLLLQVYRFLKEDENNLTQLQNLVKESLPADLLVMPKFYGLKEWWDVSTGSEMGSYRIEEKIIGYYTTKELAEAEITKINNKRRRFSIIEINFTA